MGCDVPRKIDLHIHSTASDGTWTPPEILNQAEALNLGAIAITDHDTLKGAAEAIASGIPPSVKFLTGVEISANPPANTPFSDSLHILGYQIDINHKEINETLLKLREARKDRNPAILRRLDRLGLALSLEEVRQNAGPGQMGRPHIARLMVAKGFAKNIHHAFQQYLGKGKPAYVDKYRVSSSNAIAVIRESGGIPVLAHPGLLETDRADDLETLVAVMKEMGLMGIEAYYSGHLPRQTAGYIALAQRHDLLVTGGSDFHGAMYPDVQMGVGKGDLCVPYEVYENLLKRK